jgi:NNP family nitrate/nitrite transporter-like MFS transporter
MGASCNAGGLYLAHIVQPKVRDFTVLMGVFSVAAIFTELGNGANFALVPHCNAYNNVGKIIC